MPDLWSGLLRLVRTGTDMTARQLSTLHLCSLQAQTVRGLAESMNIAKPAVSRAVDVLAERGYVERRDDPDDRRSVLVYLTKAGREFIATL